MTNITPVKANDLIQGNIYILSRNPCTEDNGIFIKQDGIHCFFEVTGIEPKKTKLYRVKVNSYGLLAPFVIVNGRTLAVFEI